MDNLFWKKNKSHISKNELVALIQEILEKDKWIIDRNYKSTINKELKRQIPYFSLIFQPNNVWNRL